MPKKSRIFISWTKCRPYYCIYQYCIYLLERMIYVYGSVQWRESRTECPGPGLVQVKNSNFGHIFNNFPVPNLSRICPCVRTMFFPVQFPVVSCPSSQQWNSNKSDAARDVLAKGVCLFVLAKGVALSKCINYLTTLCGRDTVTLSAWWRKMDGKLREGNGMLGKIMGTGCHSRPVFCLWTRNKQIPIFLPRKSAKNKVQLSR